MKKLLECLVWKFEDAIKRFSGVFGFLVLLGVLVIMILKTF